MKPAAFGVLNACLLLAAIAAFIGLVGLYDYWAAAHYGIEATISRGFERIWYFWPGAAFGMGLFAGFVQGFLAGHFGAAQPPLED